MARPAAWSLGTLVMRGVPFQRLFFKEYPVMGTNVFKKLCKFISTRGKGTNSIYFRDPAGNLVEIIIPGSWPVDNL
jgi:hypothetical protein